MLAVKEPAFTACEAVKEPVFTAPEAVIVVTDKLFAYTVPVVVKFPLASIVDAFPKLKEDPPKV